MPALILMGAIGAAAYASLAAPLGNPFVFALGAGAVGGVCFLFRFVGAAAGLGGRPGAWPYAFWSIVGRTGEAIGALGYFVGGGRPRQKTSA